MAILLELETGAASPVAAVASDAPAASAPCATALASDPTPKSAGCGTADAPTAPTKAPALKIAPPPPARDNGHVIWTFGPRFVSVWWAGPGLYADQWPGACQEWVRREDGVWLETPRDALAAPLEAAA